MVKFEHIRTPVRERHGIELCFYMKTVVNPNFGDFAHLCYVNAITLLLSSGK